MLWPTGNCTFSSVFGQIYYFMHLSTVMIQTCIAELENCWFLRNKQKINITLAVSICFRTSPPGVNWPVGLFFFTHSSFIMTYNNYSCSYCMHALFTDLILKNARGCSVIVSDIGCFALVHLWIFSFQDNNKLSRYWLHPWQLHCLLL